MNVKQTKIMEHKSVLFNEILEGLEIKDGDIFVDMTLGGAGHTEGVLQKSQELGHKDITVVGIDADHEAKQRAEKRLAKYTNPKLIFETIYFDSIDEVLEKHDIKKVDKVLFDLGYSSFEIDSDDRGFSFMHEGPLKMTYSQNPSEKELTAYDVVNSFQEENLADIIYGFGEEQFSRRIAKGIVEAREIAPIETTKQLAQIISDSVPNFYRHHKDGGKSKIHPATKTFQAIRIAVNSELERLKIALRKTLELLDKEGRIAVISFHSLEDRIVKRFFKEKAKEGIVKLVNKKPIVPTKEELSDNPRSRSAKLRIIEKL
jgi:16S rRNA (cytosine1402-N4)-methyltransferase